MNSTLIITVAGTSTRFRESINKDVLKCLFRTENCYSILELQLDYAKKTDIKNVIIVGGYKFTELEAFVKNYKKDELVIQVIYNPKYEIWGSNYSLYLGLLYSLKFTKSKKIIFIEGDLIVDLKSFKSIISSDKNVISFNNKQINARESVVFYITTERLIKYIYDLNHSYFIINESFTSIFNSGQIWVFNEIELIKNIIENFDDNDLNDTNLNTIQKYFNKCDFNQINFIEIVDWYNCNTFTDYYDGIKKILE